MIEYQALGRSKAAREHGDSRALVQRETCLSVGQGNDAREQSEPCIEDLGVAGALRRVIVEQHDAVGQCHRARRPRQQCLAGEQTLQIKEPQPVGQHGHMASRHQHGGGRFDELPKFLNVRHDAGALLRTKVTAKIRMFAFDRPQVLAIERAQRVHRGTLCTAEQIRIACAPYQFACRVLGMLEPQPIQILQLAQSSLPLPIRLVQLGIMGEHPLGACIERKIGDRQPHVRAQFVDLAFTLLPSGGNRHQLPLDAEAAERQGQIRFLKLRAENNDVGHGEMIEDCQAAVVSEELRPPFHFTGLHPKLPGKGIILRTRLIVSAALLAATFSAAAEPQTFNAESLLGWRFVGDPRVSPDGRRIAYVHASVNRDQDSYDRDLWIAENGAAARQLTTGTHDDDSPRWSPDGRRLAFASNRSGKRQLHVLEFPGGEPWQLTMDAEGVGAFAWSPDGKQIAFASHTALAGDAGFEPQNNESQVKDDTRAKPPFVTERLIYRFDGAPGYRDVKCNQIWIVATDRGPRQAAQRLTSGALDAGDPVWSIDGKRIYFSAVRRDDADYEPDDTEIFSVAVDDGSMLTPLTQHRGPDDDPLPSPDGKWIAFTGYDEKEPPLSSSVTNLYVMRPDGTDRRQLAVDFDRNVGEVMLADVAAPRTGGDRIAWSADSRRLLFVAADRGQDHLYEVEIGSGNFAPLTRFRQGDLREFSVSRSGSVAATFSSPTRPASIYTFALQAAGGKAWREVSDLGDGMTAAGGFSEYEEIWFDSFDGQRIQGWIVKPPEFDPARRYPTVLYIHGGPHAMYGTGFFHEFQMLVRSGFMVLITNPRGSTGYGGEFANVIQYRYPGDDFRDLMTAVDVLIKRGYSDPDRLGVAGGSGGGLLTSWTVGQTDRFAAAVVERAVTNWHSFVGTSDLNYWFVRRWFRDFPWRDSADYLARSPLMHVDNVKTPVLVIHNEQDYRTALDQGLQFYAALKMQKKPAKLAVFPQSSHGMSREGRPSQRVSRLNLIEGWFAEKLEQKP